MRPANCTKVFLLLVLSSALCGCDLKLLKALQQQSTNIDNSIDITDSTVTISIVTSQVSGGGGNGNGGASTPGGFTSGTFPVSTTASTLPGDLHFRGTNHTSFLPPVAPSAVGNPF